MSDSYESFTMTLLERFKERYGSGARVAWSGGYEVVSTAHRTFAENLMVCVKTLAFMFGENAELMFSHPNEFDVYQVK